ncbi:MAG: S8 family serine peptidase, partial [Planctomycetota bacterium]
PSSASGGREEATRADRCERLLCEPHVPNELVLCFEGYATESQIGGVLAAIAPVSTEKILVVPDKESPLNRTYHVKLGGVDVRKALERVLAEDVVRYAEPNYIVYPAHTPNDPYYSSSGTWGQAYDDLWGLKALECATAWDTETGQGVIVAVIDSGCDITHPDLQGSFWVNTGEIPGNFQDDDGNGYADDVHGWNFAHSNSDIQDLMGHGTHVAGIIAAVADNSEGVVGVAYGAQIMVVKGLGGGGGTGTAAQLASCIYYAVHNGADVLNLSWCTAGYSQVVEDALYLARGRVVVASAGDDSSDASGYYPGRSEYVLTVSSYGPDGAIASTSNFGSCIDVAAPGVDILSCKPSSVFAGTPVGQYYTRMSGTSMAAAHVSGLAALVLADRPGLDSEEVRHVLRSSATDGGVSGRDPHFGHGVPNAPAALAFPWPPRAVIHSPTHEQQVSGTFPITGTAAGASSGSVEWTVDYGSGPAPSAWTTLYSATGMCINSSLAHWDTTGLPLGEYTLRLTVTGYSATVEDYVTVELIADAPPYVSLTPSSATLYVGIASQQFAAVTNNATDSGYTWESGNPAVATVDANGLVTPVSEGTATLAVTGNDTGLIDTASVTVYQPVATVHPQTLAIAMEEKEALSASTTHVPDTSYTWTTSDASVATVDASGVVTGVSTGQCIVRATGDVTGVWDECTVTVGPHTWVTDGGCSCLVASPDGKFIFILSSDALGKVYVFDAPSGKRIAELDCGGYLSCGVCSFDSTMLFVGSRSDDTLYMFRLPDLTSAGTVPLSGDPGALAAGRPDRLYAIVKDVGLSVIDVPAATVTASVGLGSNYGCAAATPDGNILLISGRTLGTCKYDISTDAVVLLDSTRWPGSRGKIH